MYRAAQYVRMSTEHQQYSTENQGDKIREYAARRNIEIVRTYADEGKSGLRIVPLAFLFADAERQPAQIPVGQQRGVGGGEQPVGFGFRNSGRYRTGERHEAHDQHARDAVVGALGDGFGLGEHHKRRALVPADDHRGRTVQGGPERFHRCADSGEHREQNLFTDRIGGHASKPRELGAHLGAVGQRPDITHLIGHAIDVIA